MNRQLLINILYKEKDLENIVNKIIERRIKKIINKEVSNFRKQIIKIINEVKQNDNNIIR